MCCVRAVFALAGFATALQAADPFVGEWTQQTAKSIYNKGTAPKAQSILIAQADGNLNLRIEETSAAARRMSVRVSVPAAGGTGKIIQAPYETVSAKRIDPFRLELTFTNARGITFSARMHVSLDGTTMAAIVNGADTFGKPIDAVVVYFKE